MGDTVVRRAAYLEAVERMRQARLGAESRLLDCLLKQKILAPEEREQIWAQLERIGHDGRLSALEAMDRAGKDVLKALVLLSRESGMPLLPLARFVPQKKAFALLPAEFATRWGALPFDFLDHDLLVTVLSPFDVALQKEVRTVSGRRCIFYLVPPADYGAGLAAILKA